MCEFVFYAAQCASTIRLGGIQIYIYVGCHIHVDVSRKCLDGALSDIHL